MGAFDELMAEEAPKKKGLDSVLFTEDPVEKPVTPEITFGERVEKSLFMRGKEVEETLEAHAKGEIGTFRANVEVFGKGFVGSIFDIAGAGLAEAGELFVETFPETTEDIKRGWDLLANTSAGKVAGDALEGGIKSYKEFRESFPAEAKTLEATVNIGLLLAPVKVKVKAEPSILGKTAKAIEISAQRSIRRSRRELIKDLVSPVKTKKVLEAETARTTEVGKGPFKRSQVALSPRELEMAAEIKKITGVNNKKTIQGNLNAVIEANKNIAIELNETLKNSKIIIPKTEVISNIEDAIERLIRENPVVVGNAETTARRVAQKAKELVESKPGTPKGILDARKELDAWIKSQKGDKAFDPIMENALSVAVRSVRQSLNNTVSNSIPSARVKASLKRQNILFEAIDNIAPKAAKETNNAIFRAWENSAKVLPFRGRANQELALLFGIGGLGAAAKFAPWITAAAGATVASIVAKKIIMSPNTRKGISLLIKMTDRAILSSKNPSMIRQLRLDRMSLIAAIKSSEEEDLE